MKNTVRMLVILVSLSLPLLPGGVRASPEAVVQEATSRVITALREKRELLRKDPAHARRLIENAVAPYIDFRIVSRLALGRHWKSATPKQRDAFTQAFRTLLVRVYSKALTTYALNEKEPDAEIIKFLPPRAQSRADRATVRTKIARPDGPAIPVDYSLLERQGVWKVYDVKVDGISLVFNYRASFAGEIKASGIDGLIELLVQRNKTPPTNETLTDDAT